MIKHILGLHSFSGACVVSMTAGVCISSRVLYLSRLARNMPPSTNLREAGSKFQSHKLSLLVGLEPSST